MKEKLHIFLAICLLTSISALSQNWKYPFQNFNLSFEERVADLVGRLTLEEKVAQMLNAAPAIPRLGIPAYDWWNETLHGVARTPYNVTVYPQAIGMAATFDTAALFTMADFSATEGRVIFNKAIQDGKTGARYLGLTYWTPNINIFRDPRWGRGQETYGEDPFLTATLGDAFVRGLQGNDPKYIKAAACAKHYAVHSGPEPQRHVFNADVSAYDLWDTYLPAFQKLVKESKVVGVMCAYNAFRKQPCCASDLLMTDILRNQWGFKGYVTSDCWAIDDFFKNHKTHPDAASASADAVMHGTDLDCGTAAYKALVEAVKNKQITEQQIDVSVKRLFMVRFQLGLFDPVNMVKYAQTPATKLEAPEHAKHALNMARASIVLLKNSNNTLPLSKQLKKIVVLGPNANNHIAQLGNYNGTPSKLITILQGIQDKVGQHTKVVYEKAINFTNQNVLTYDEIIKDGFKAAYFNNTNLQGDPVHVTTEKKLEHYWQEGESITPKLRANDFSARYTANYKASENKSITFELEADDGFRFILNGKTIFDSWNRKPRDIYSHTLEAQKDSVYNIILEFWQGSGSGKIRLSTGHIEVTDFSSLTSRHKDADVFIVAGGLSPQLEGEEMKVSDPGFLGGDRTSIMLPAVQTQLMKALQATGKPVVFVMLTGSAIATPWESEHLPAILNAWYGGQSGGTAVADVLFGDYNPSGRLPVTFYKSDADLPAFEDYAMTNRTYRYFSGQPLYGFGYGLSYTTFQYDQLKMPVTANSGQTFPVSVRVTNTGKRAGDEVVQLYVVKQDGSIKAPLKSLKGFKRIGLKPRESRVVTFKLSPADLSYVDANGVQHEFNGKVQISVGGHQPGENNPANSNIVNQLVTIRP
jgi:beta-glucosidase